MLDGHGIKDLQLKWLREQMGLVSQEPALFATNIAGNILFGKSDADMNQITEAAKASNAHSFIEKLPKGYQTQVHFFFKCAILRYFQFNCTVDIFLCVGD